MDKRRVPWLTLLIFFVLMLSQAVFAQEKPVTSEKLTDEDVMPYLKNVVAAEWKGIILGRVVGVYQNGNQAEIFFTSRPNFEGATENWESTLTVIRFTSGVWFDPKRRRILTK